MQKVIKANKTENGFTIIEVMMSLFIFALVMMGAFAAFAKGLNFVENSRHYTRSSQIMQSETERIRSMPWAAVTALPASEPDVDFSSYFGGQYAQHYRHYTLSRMVTLATTTCKIDLTVSWVDQQGKSHSNTYVMQYTKEGIYSYVQ